jgi:hypothetical protein
MRNAGCDCFVRLSLCLLLFLAPKPTFGQDPTFRSQSNVVIVPALVRDVGVEQTSQLDESAEAEPLSLMVAVQTGTRKALIFRRFGYE